MPQPPVPRRGVFWMIVLLAAGVGVCVLGLLAIGFGIPISDTSFGNALLIAGVVILCTGVILIGMWLVAREMSNLAKLVIGQGARAPGPPRPAVPPSLFPAPSAERPAAAVADSPPPWAEQAATRSPPPRPAAPENAPAEPEPVAAVPDRPARRNLLFATKRRDNGGPTAPLPTPALEAEPKVSFENAWPSPARTNGAADPASASADAASREAASGGDAPVDADAAKPPKPDLPAGVTVIKSGTVDGMAYSLYSDGSIEAQFPGESPIRFASFDALKAHVEQQRQ